VKKKLSLNKETIRNLSAEEMKGVAGANTNTDTTVDLCCASCGTCNTLICPTQWWTCAGCITGVPNCVVTNGLNTCDC
jgi:hypothetical protein